MSQVTREAGSADEFLMGFVDSVTKFIAELEAKKVEIEKLGQDDRTLKHHYRKMIVRWFYINGGL